MSGRRPARATLVSMTALAMLLAGCFDTAEPTPPPSPTPVPEPTPAVTSYRLDTKVWYAGLEVTFGSAVSTLDPKGGTVVVDIALSNPGDEDAELEGPIRLTSGGREVDPTRETQIPLVSAEASATATVTFDVDATFDVPRSVLRVGRDTEHQAIVPLTAGATPPTTLEPFIQPLDAAAVAGQLRLDVDFFTLQADLPDWDLELGADVMALTINYGATYRGDFAAGMPFTADNISLKLPNGDTISPRRDGRSQSVAILRPTKRNALMSRFEVPSPGSGKYTLVFTDGSASKAIPFEIVLPGS